MHCLCETIALAAGDEEEYIPGNNDHSKSSNAASQIIIDYGDETGLRIAQGAIAMGGFASDVQILNHQALDIERNIVSRIPIPGGKNYLKLFL